MIHVCYGCGRSLGPDTPGEGVSDGLCMPCLERLYPQYAEAVKRRLALTSESTPEGKEV